MNVTIEPGALFHQAPYLATLKCRIALFCDDKIAPLYGKPFLDSLTAYGLDTQMFSFPYGEKYKTRETKESLENQLLDHKFGRDTCIVALGGGVVTDLVGFLASTYCRGVPLVSIPTTLLGMVDAAIGGKNGVNVPQGKNLIGSIYHPKKIVIDPLVLNSLPKKELCNGIVEIIKISLVTDEKLFNFLEENVVKILNLDMPTLSYIIAESCRLKQNIVEQDERDQNIRHLLNFGHTVGHAIENLSEYTIAHGEAVAIGIAIETRLAMHMKHIDQKIYQRVISLLQKYGMNIEIPDNLTHDSLIQAMTLDKKSIKGIPRFIILKSIGNAFCTSVNHQDICFTKN